MLCVKFMYSEIHQLIYWFLGCCQVGDVLAVCSVCRAHANCVTDLAGYVLHVWILCPSHCHRQGTS